MSPKTKALAALAVVLVLLGVGKLASKTLSVRRAERVLREASELEQRGRIQEALDLIDAELAGSTSDSPAVERLRLERSLLAQLGASPH